MKFIRFLLSLLIKLIRRLAGENMQAYSADFETTTQEDDCRVWAYGLCKIGEPERFMFGNTIEDFLQWCEFESNNATLYFHNLKFDAEFIICELFKRKFEYVKVCRHPREKKDIPVGMPREVSSLEDMTFTSLISDKGQFYSMSICFYAQGKHKRQIKIIDSLKMIPFSVKKIAKDFGLKIKKGEIDYKLYREKGHKLTEEEIDYLRNDCEIMARALQMMFDEGLTKTTVASNALKNYQDMLGGKKRFRHLFPIPENDVFVREAYKGGFTYLDPRYKNVEIAEGIVLDVNSLYPWSMRYCKMPYDDGVYFDGHYKTSRLYTLYVQMFTCHFEIKPDHIPTIQLKHSKSFFLDTEYATDSKGQDITLCLTNVDLLLFFDQYEVYNITWIGGWMYKGAYGLFDEYVDYWTGLKIQASIDKNSSMRTKAKLMQNALYGRFALSPKCKSKHPRDNKGAVQYFIGEEETREPVYLPVGAFITAYCREKTIRSAQKLYDVFVYADTDSLHLRTTDLDLVRAAGIEIDPNKLGFWKHETTFKKARFVRQKTYMEFGKDPYDLEAKDEWKITCAGLPECAREKVTFKNFQPNAKYYGKLMPKHVKGGIVLKETEFTLKEGKSL